MRLLAARFAAVAIALTALSAFFGGWATITVEDLPDAVVTGAATTLTFTVRQHGVAPLPDLEPKIEARLGRRTVEARAVARGPQGRYSASLAFPEAGEWTITVHSGFGHSKLTLLPLQAVSEVSQVSSVVLSPIDRGRRLFVAKGCVACHANSAARYADKPWDAGAPDLSGRTYPAAFLAQQLTNPAAAAAAQRKETRMPNLGLKPGEITALTAFINGDRQAATRP
jgi:hypothetical protein